MPKIQRYISNELTHFVGRGKVPDEQYSLLVQILRSGWLTHPPHNPNISGNLSINTTERLSANKMYSPQVVCFCDIPIEDLHIHTSKYSCFGFSLSKEFVAQQGGAPVFYVPLNTNIRWSRNEEVFLGELFDRNIPKFHELIFQIIKTQRAPHDLQQHLDLLQFLEFRLMSFVKFFDNNLPDDDPNNFYMEREWRVVGNIHFSLEDVMRICIPQDYKKRFGTDFPDFSGQVTFID